MGNRFPSGAFGGWMADIWLLLESWLCFTVLEEPCPIFAVVLGMLCVPPSGCVPVFQMSAPCLRRRVQFCTLCPAIWEHVVCACQINS